MLAATLLLLSLWAHPAGSDLHQPCRPAVAGLQQHPQRLQQRENTTGYCAAHKEYVCPTRTIRGVQRELHQAAVMIRVVINTLFIVY